MEWDNENGVSPASTNIIEKNTEYNRVLPFVAVVRTYHVNIYLCVESDPWGEYGRKVQLLG